MKKFTLKGIHLYLFGLGVATAFFALVTYIPSDNDSKVRIDKYTADITFDNNGDMTVHEVWDMYYTPGYRVRFRDIEYEKFPTNYPFPHEVDNVANFDMKNYDMKFFKNGTDYTDQVRFGYSFLGDYDEQFERVDCPEDAPDKCESFFIDTKGAGNLSGDVRFEYDYTIENVITQYSDISELNWVLFEYAENTVLDGEINITLPNDFNEYHLFNRAIDYTVTEKQSNSISFSFENKTNDTPLGFRLLVPIDTFSEIQSSQQFLNQEMNKESILAYENQLIEHDSFYENSSLILYSISLIASLIVGLGTVFIIKKAFFTPPVVNHKSNVVSPPTDHSPAVVGFLYHNQAVLPEHISATLLDLIHRGYIIVDDTELFENKNYSIDDLIHNERQRVKLKQDPLSKYDSTLDPVSVTSSYDFEENFTVDLVLNKEKPLSELKEYEQVVINTYINKLGDGTKVSIKEIKKQAEKASEASKFTLLNHDFEVAVRSEASQYKYFDETFNKKKSRIALLSILPLLIAIPLIYFHNQFYVFEFLTVVPILLSIIYIYTVVFQKKIRTVWGEQFYHDWDSYKQNLEQLKILTTSNISDVEYWDSNLVYATIFDIAEKVLDDLETATPLTQTDDVLTSYTDRHHNIHSSYFLRRRLCSVHSDNHYRATSTITAATRSSSGGGGSFGGGGGGGRSR